MVKTIMAAIAICASLSCVNLFAGSIPTPLTPPTKITYTFTDALKQYINNNPGATDGKNVFVSFKYFGQRSDEPINWYPSWNLINQSWETIVSALQDINNYPFQLEPYAGMDEVFFGVPLDTPDNSLACKASPEFDRNMQYNTLAFTVDYDQSAPGHCTMQWTAT